MPRGKRSFTPEERLAFSRKQTRMLHRNSRKNNLSSALLAKWKQRYLAKRAEGLKRAGFRRP